MAYPPIAIRPGRIRGFGLCGRAEKPQCWFLSFFKFVCACAVFLNLCARVRNFAALRTDFALFPTSLKNGLNL